MEPVTVRSADPADLPRIAAIYDEQVRTAISTFDIESARAGLLGGPAGQRPSRATTCWSPLALPATVVGYAYSSAYRPRPAYARTREVSVYLDDSARGQGLGRQLYDELLGRLRRRRRAPGARGDRAAEPRRARRCTGRAASRRSGSCPRSGGSSTAGSTPRSGPAATLLGALPVRERVPTRRAAGSASPASPFSRGAGRARRPIVWRFRPLTPGDAVVEPTACRSRVSRGASLAFRTARSRQPGGRRRVPLAAMPASASPTSCARQVGSRAQVSSSVSSRRRTTTSPNAPSPPGRPPTPPTPTTARRW